MTRDEAVASLAARLERVTVGESSAVLSAEAASEASELAASVASEPLDVQAAYLLGGFYWLRHVLASTGVIGHDHATAVAWFAKVLPWEPDAVPAPLLDELARQAPPGGDTPAAWSDEGVRLMQSPVAGNPHITGRAVGLFRRAVAATATEHPDRPCYLSNLGLAVRTRFEQAGDPDDIETAVKANQEAVDLTPPAGPNRASHLSNLGIALRTRFEHTGTAADLDAAIDAGQEAADITPPDSPDRAAVVSNLGIALRSRFECLGVLTDLDAAILANEEAVDITPPGHDGHARYANNLSIAQLTRFERLGDIADIDAAVATGREAAEGTASDNAARPGRLDSLGIALRSRFDRTGDLADLDAAIAIGREAVDTTPADHIRRAGRLNNLGIALQGRYQRVGDQADLDAAIQAGREAIDITAFPELDLAMYWNNVGTALQLRYRRTGDVADLDAAVRAGRSSVDTTPLGHPSRASRLNNQCAVLRTRFQLLGEPNDLDAAIEAGREGVDMIAADHPDRGGYLSNLGVALLVRFEDAGAVADLSDAVQACREAVNATPHDHPERGAMLVNLAGPLQAHYELTGDGDSLRAALLALDAGVKTASAAPAVRARCAIRAARLLTPHDNERALGAWEAALSLVPQVIDRSLDRDDRRHALRLFDNLGTSAAAAALAAGQTRRAWEVLEQGRGVLLAQALETSNDPELRRLHPELADALHRLRQDLNADARPDPKAAQDVATTRRRAALEWPALMETIRATPGFEDFGLAPTTQRLHHVVGADALVFINVSWRCDALIVTSTSVDHVALDGLDSRFAVDQANSFRAAADSPSRSSNRAMSGILAWLWDTVTGPILAHLGHTHPPADDAPWPRVWWSPTGPLTVLPLHASGSAGGAVLDHVVSSYTTTARLLAQSRRPGSEISRTGIGGRAMVIGLGQAPGHPSLAFAVSEAQAVATRLGATLRLVDAEATVASVRAGLEHAELAHFACHGRPAPDPANSHLAMWDGQLPVREIAKLDLPQARLAYLSACTTAFGGPTLLDESVHIASAFQVAGFAHVVATLWAINDRYAHHLADGFYERFLSGEEPARATHEAVRALRADFPTTPYLWAPYVHFGP